MAKSTVNVRYLILGLLIQKPMTGYDIKSLLESFSWLIGSPSYGSLYPALHGLLDDGYVAVDVINEDEKPPRKVYHITDAGRQALHTWIDRPVIEAPSLKAFLMHLILADNYSREGLLAYLNHRRVQVTEHHRALLDRLQENHAQQPLEPLALDYGLAMAKQELNWLEKMIDRLS
ncbi:MAG: PadR family transcriptional regulator [Anaerolineae bacterium]